MKVIKIESPDPVKVTIFSASAEIITMINVSNYNVLADIQAELGKARTKFPGNKHMLTATGEEFGELCQAILQQEQEPEKGKTHEHVYAEAIQLACMAIRLATEGDADYPLYDPESGYRGPGWEGYNAHSHA